MLTFIESLGYSNIIIVCEVSKPWHSLNISIAFIADLKDHDVFYQFTVYLINDCKHEVGSCSVLMC